MNTKTTTKTFVEIIKPFTFNYYGDNTVEIGTRFKATKRNLTNEGYIHTLGHGAEVMIPCENFKLVDVTRTINVTTTERNV